MFKKADQDLNNAGGKPAFAEIKRLRRRLRFFRLVSFFLAGFILLAVAGRFIWRSPENFRNFDNIDNKAPYCEEVKKILKPLLYSGLEDLLQPDVKINLSFVTRTWGLQNIHRFDKYGKVVLVDNRYGLCGDLAAYVHDRIKPLFGEDYNIEFVKVAESGYFLSPRASHIALLISKRSMFSQETYLLDPAFHKYGSQADLDEYLIFKKTDKLAFVENKNTDESFRAGVITPILIKNDFLVGLLVDEQNGKFDNDNFIFAITVTRRFKYSGRYALALRKVQGQTDILENEYLAHKVLGKETYDKLREKLISMFNSF